MAYTANSASSELIAGPTLSTLSSAEGNGAAFITPEKYEQRSALGPLGSRGDGSSYLSDR